MDLNFGFFATDEHRLAQIRKLQGPTGQASREIPNPLGERRKIAGG
jgi:hypothetical protein